MLQVTLQRIKTPGSVASPPPARIRINACSVPTPITFYIDGRNDVIVYDIIECHLAEEITE